MFQEILMRSCCVDGTQCCNQEGNIKPVPLTASNCIIELLFQLALFLGLKTVAAGLGSKNCIGEVFTPP
jgi:hypothetical protein